MFPPAENTIFTQRGKTCPLVRKSNNSQPALISISSLINITRRLPDGISLNQVPPQTRSRAVIYLVCYCLFCLNAHQTRGEREQRLTRPTTTVKSAHEQTAALIQIRHKQINPIPSPSPSPAWRIISVLH